MRRKSKDTYFAEYAESGVKIYAYGMKAEGASLGGMKSVEQKRGTRGGKAWVSVRKPDDMYAQTGYNETHDFAYKFKNK